MRGGGREWVKPRKQRLLHVPERRALRDVRPGERGVRARLQPVRRVLGQGAAPELPHVEDALHAGGVGVSVSAQGGKWGACLLGAEGDEGGERVCGAGGLSLRVGRGGGRTHGV